MSRLNAIFAFWAILLLVSTGLTVFYYYVRGWKFFQAEFMRIQSDRIEQELKVANDATTKAKLADLDRIYAMLKEKPGRIDVLFANAGTYDFGTLGTITEEHFDKIFDTNVRGLLFTVQKALPLLSDGASVILTGSIASSFGIPSMSVYSASKAAVRSFARSWTSDLKNRRIRVNAISPGPIETPIFNAMNLTPDQVNQFKTDVVTGVPLGRMGRPEELAKAALFLASDDSSYITGIELFVDGGMAQV